MNVLELVNFARNVQLTCGLFFVLLLVLGILLYFGKCKWLERCFEPAHDPAKDAEWWEKSAERAMQRVMASAQEAITDPDKLAVAKVVVSRAVNESFSAEHRQKISEEITQRESEEASASGMLGTLKRKLWPARKRLSAEDGICKAV